MGDPLHRSGNGFAFRGSGSASLWNACGFRKKLTLLPQWKTAPASLVLPEKKSRPLLNSPRQVQLSSESLPLTGHRLGRPTQEIPRESIAGGLPLGLRPQKLEEELNPNPEASSSRLLDRAGRGDSTEARANEIPEEGSSRRVTSARRPAAGAVIWLKRPFNVQVNAAGRARPRQELNEAACFLNCNPSRPAHH